MQYTIDERINELVKNSICEQLSLMDEDEYPLKISENNLKKYYEEFDNGLFLNWSVWYYNDSNSLICEVKSFTEKENNNLYRVLSIKDYINIDDNSKILEERIKTTLICFDFDSKNQKFRKEYDFGYNSFIRKKILI